MAYAPNLLDEEEKKQQAAQSGQGQATPEQVGGASLLGGGGSAPANAQAKPSNSGWTNIRSYLDANAPQASQLAGKVSENIVGQGEAAKQSMQNLTSGYEQTLAKSAVPKNYQQMIDEANKNPTSFASNPQQVESFNQLRQGLFNAPSAFTDEPKYGEAVTKSQEASNLKSMAETPGGQQTLIKNLNPNMTQGQTNLNQLLLGGDVAARSKISEAARPYADLRKNLEDTATQQEKARQETIAAVEPAKKAVQEQFVNPQTESLKKLNEEILKRQSDYAAEQSAQDSSIKRMMDYVKGYTTNFSEKYRKPGEGDRMATNLTLEDVLKWNSRPDLEEMWRRNFTPDLRYSPFFSEALNYAYHNPTEGTDWISKVYPGTSLSKGDISQQTVTTPEEYAKMLAIQNLTGNENLYLTPEQQASAGTYVRPKITPIYNKK